MKNEMLANTVLLKINDYVESEIIINNYYTLVDLIINSCQLNYNDTDLSIIDSRTILQYLSVIEHDKINKKLNDLKKD